MNKEDVQKNIEQLLKVMGITFESVVFSEIDGRGVFAIKTAESHLLIGGRGTHLSAFNHLIKRIASKGMETGTETLNFFIDVNDYHEKLVQDIKNKATILAGRARSFKTNIEMEPMSSYERMVVHTLFQDASDIKTESAGVGSGRHVVLKYVEPTGGESKF